MNFDHFLQAEHHPVTVPAVIFSIVTVVVGAVCLFHYLRIRRLLLRWAAKAEVELIRCRLASAAEPFGPGALDLELTVATSLVCQFTVQGLDGQLHDGWACAAAGRSWGRPGELQIKWDVAERAETVDSDGTDSASANSTGVRMRGMLMFLAGGAAILLMWRYGMIERVFEFIDAAPRRLSGRARSPRIWTMLILVAPLMTCAAGFIRLVTGRSLHQLDFSLRRLSLWQQLLLFCAILAGVAGLAFLVYRTIQ